MKSRRCVVFFVTFMVYAASMIAPKQEADRFVEQFKHLSLRKKIAQLFMVGAYSSPTPEYDAVIRKLILEEGIGSLIFMQGNARDQISITNDYQSISSVPLLIATDCEWGVGMRLSDVPVLPHSMTVGATQDYDLAYMIGRLIGRQCKKLGIALALCPVLDINNNPKNLVINDRSFGENKDCVTEKGLAVMQGIQDEGVAACGKHFPGHGDTKNDSHFELPVVNRSLEELLELEIVPFKAAIDQGIKSIMMGHLAIPKIDNAPTISATLSPTLTQEILREKLGFKKGVVVTDSLIMQAVANYFSPSQASLKALQAGCSALVFCESTQKPAETYARITSSIEAIEKAVLDGTVPEHCIDERLEEIVALKKWSGLDRTKGHITTNPTSLQSSKLERLANRIIFRSALTLVQNNNDLLPLQEGMDATLISMGQTKNSQAIKNLSSHLNLKEITLESPLLEEDLLELAQLLEHEKTVIVMMHNMNKFAQLQWGISNPTLSLLDYCKQKGKNVIIVLLGNPYSLSLFNHEDAIIVGYEDHPEAECAALDIIRGHLSPSGALPITASKKFTEGLCLTF